MARKDLPMGDEHDSLQSQADAALSKDGKPVKRTVLTQNGAYTPEERARARSVANGLDRGTESRLERIRRESREADDRRAKLQRERPDLFAPTKSYSRTADPDAHYVNLGGMFLSKKEFVDFASYDLPKLIDEAIKGETQRGKFMQLIMLPKILKALEARNPDKDPSDGTDAAT